MNPALGEICVTPDVPIRTAMEAIARGTVETALIVDESGRLVGTLTDGDVRRALLAGAALDDPVGPHVHRDPTWVGPEADRSGVLDLMRARLISQIPVLDGSRRVIGLHVLRQMLGAVTRGNVAVILAGGRGARLRPLTDGLPKPMLRVAGRPILERIVHHLVGSGIRKVYLAVNYMADVIIDHFGDGSAFGCDISYVTEESTCPLGTCGALRLLPPDVVASDAPILVMNGDLVVQFDLGQLLSAHETARSVATVGTRQYVHDVPFGVLGIDNGKLISLDEKPTHFWSVNAGVYVLSPRLIERIPPECEFHITELLADCLERGESIGIHPIEGDWVDVGRLDDLIRARGDRQ